MEGVSRPRVTARRSKPQIYGITPGVRSGGYRNWSGSVNWLDTAANNEAGYANWPTISTVKRAREVLDLVSDDVNFAIYYFIIIIIFLKYFSLCYKI